MHNRTTTMMSIPRPFMRMLRWHEGDHVNLSVQGDALVAQSVERHLVAVTSPSTRGGNDEPAA